ncbi:MAG: polymer-forming cytoskeletal protein [Cyclobacteriaceae bacterium]
MGDLVVTGGTVTVDRDVLISGDLLVISGEVLIDGNVNGDIKSTSGTLTLNGDAHRSIDCRGGKLIINGQVSGDATLACNQIEIGSKASFEKAVRYWNDKGSAEFHGSVKNGTAIFDPSLEIESGRWHYLGFASLLMIWYMGTALLFIVLVNYLFGRTFRNAANNIKNSSLKSLGLVRCRKNNCT